MNSLKNIMNINKFRCIIITIKLRLEVKNKIYKYVNKPLLKNKNGSINYEYFP